MKRFLPFLTALPLLAEPGDKIYQKGFLSKEKAQQSIELKDGYGLELVLSDPDIREPMAMAWDGNGALYVVEMRTYMQDADATNEKESTSRISRHEDTDGDGVYDKHTVFIDNLKLPRMVLPLDEGRVMVGITDTLDLWNYTDTDGDGVADKKEKIYEGGKRGGNMEHQPSGLIWNLDNWIYLTYENKRYRYTDGKFEVEKIPRGGGQWGIGRDDSGRIYFSAAGGEKPAFFFQQPLEYGALDLSGQEEKGFREVFPIANVPDVQGGRRRINATGGLNNFTGCAGQGIYRGDRLPADLKGDLLIPEPVGRLIRRATVTRENGMTVLSNTYPKSEFIRAKDVNFRPVWSTTSPDGGMMIIDAHRGIIQQGNWTRPGSFLRGVIDKWGLAKNIGKGRVYRLVHTSYKPDKQPRMYEESTAQLVRHLAHPNGWWRDTAQKLIILREDRESVVPALDKMVRTEQSELGRLHALWTLEGMSKLEPETVVTALNDKSSLVRTSAVRLAEPFLNSQPTVIRTLINSTALPSDIEMSLQVINSTCKVDADNPELVTFVKGLLDHHNGNPAVEKIKGLQLDAEKDRAAARDQKARGEAFASAMKNGQVIYRQLCFSCHGADGGGTPMPGQKGHFLAPSFENNPRLNGSDHTAVRTLLHGLVGDLDGKEYEGLMVSMATNDDQWIADITTYIRNSFGNKSGLTEAKTVAALRKKHASRKEPWTQAELEDLIPGVLVDRSSWKLTASHNSKELDGCIDEDKESRYTTKRPMKPGMWLQVEFRKSALVSSIVLDAAKSKNDYPRGYQVEVSLDGKKWSKPVAEGNGDGALTKIDFDPVEAKFVRITQTGNNKLYWSIHDLHIHGEG